MSGVDLGVLASLARICGIALVAAPAVWGGRPFVTGSSGVVALAAAILSSRDQIIAVASPWGRAWWRRAPHRRAGARSDPGHGRRARALNTRLLPPRT